MKVEKFVISDRNTWLEWRRQDVTASDISAICGCSPYKSALQVWAEKAGEVDEPPENAAMRAGRWLEDAVLAAMREKHPSWTIAKPNTYLRAPEHRLGATPDAIAHDGKHDGIINIQCKVIGRTRFAEWKGEPPLGYQLQTATEAMLLDADYSILAVMTRGEWECDLHEFRINRNGRAEARVLDMVAEFWASVGRGETPAIDFTRDASLVAKIMAPKPELDALEIANDNRWPAILSEHEDLKANAKTITEQIEALRTEIIAKLNGAPAAVCEGWRIKHQIQELHMKATEARIQQRTVLSITRNHNGE